MLAAALLLWGAAPAPLLNAPPLKESPPVPLVPHRPALPELAGWSAPLFVQADRLGGVVFVQGGPPHLFPLQKNGRLGEVIRYDAAGTSAPPPLRAVESRGGDWLLFTPPDLRLIRDGKEKILPRLDGSPMDIGFLRGDPIVNTDAPRIQPTPRGGWRGDPPLLLRWNGKEWETFLRQPTPSGRSPYDPGRAELRAVQMFGDTRGTLWVANEYLYRIRRFSSSGKLLLELTSGRQRLQERDDAAKLQQGFDRLAKSWSKPQGATVSASAVTARRLLHAIVEGRDGKFYMLLHNLSQGAEFALDRYDPVTQTVERTPLSLEARGFLTMAAGKEALLIGSYNPKEGPWSLDWSDLDLTHWQRQRQVKIDRLAVEADEPPAP